MAGKATGKAAGMSDIEKVIRGLECCTSDMDCVDNCPYFPECWDEPADMLGEAARLDALKILKEMKGKQIEIVRCKECKNSSKSLSPYREFGRWCTRHDRYVNSDWFCADGKRKE